MYKELQGALDSAYEGELLEGFVINNDQLADWAVRKIREGRKELERLTMLGENQKAEIDYKIRHEEEKTLRGEKYLTGLLREYFEGVPHKATKTQESYKLLNGSLILKFPKVKMEKEDDTLVEYFRQNGMEEFIKVEEKPKWADFKKNLEIIDDAVVNTATGEIVDVVKLVEVDSEFSVKTT